MTELMENILQEGHEKFCQAWLFCSVCADGGSNGGGLLVVKQWQTFLCLRFQKVLNKAVRNVFLSS